jgi:hypothetical protein
MAELSQYQKIHKDTIIKEVEKSCKLGFLEQQPASKWEQILGSKVEVS